VSAAPLEIAVRPSWAHAFRGAIYDALFTQQRVYWLLRVAFAALMEVAGRSTFGQVCGPDLGLLGMVLLIVPLVWVVYPLARVRAVPAHTITILDEGLSVEADAHSLSVARERVRSVRRTLWDLVIVLDGSTFSLPLRSLPAGTLEAVVARLHGDFLAPAGAAAAPRVHVPYRSPETRPLGPEDEEAEPADWVAPSTYRESVLAFPTAGDHVRALFSTRRGSFFTPSVLLVLAGCLVLLGTAGGGDGRGELVPFTTVGAVVALMGLGSFVLELSPALLALTDRAVRERSAGVLYAVGRSGLYLRTKSFERRESWKRVQNVKIGARRIALSTSGLVHVIPMSAFRHEGARTTFVSTLEHETNKRAPAAAS
jgi:hypothetical protein